MTAYKARFGEDCAAPMIPFGAEVAYYPISDEDKARLHQFGAKVLRGIFLGYDQQAGGRWSRDLLFCDWDELAAAKKISDVHVKRQRFPEVYPVKQDDDFFFPVAEGDLQQPEEEKRNRPRRIRVRGGRRISIPDEPQSEERSSAPPPPEPAVLEPDFWTCTEHVLVRHHRQPRNGLYVPTEAECPIPLKFLDTMRTTVTDLDDYQEKYISDVWSVDRERELSSNWTGKTLFWLLKPRP